MGDEAARPSSARTRRVLFLGAVLLVLIVALFWPQAFNLHFRPSPESAWLLFLLSGLSFLGVVVLSVVLSRQVIKLYAERRAQILGSRFKTKLVIGALALSLTPVLCMFAFTYGLINRTLDKWFSQPVVTVRDDTQSTLTLLSDFITENAQTEAQAIAGSPALQIALARGNRSQMEQVLAQRRITLEKGFAAVLDAHGNLLASFNQPRGVSARLDAVGRAHVPAGNFILTHAATPGGGEVEVGMPIPAPLLAKIADLAVAQDQYARLAQERKSLRLMYITLLLLLTLAILFVATWMSLYLSKLITVPIADLAAGTQEISRGNLAYRVKAKAQDEIGVLVQSFNRMAGELETSRGQIEASRQQLESANQELEARRLYTETLLENTPSAVLSLSSDYVIERVNPAVLQLFGATAPPRRLEDIFDSASLREVAHLLRKAERWPQASGQLEVTTAGRHRTLAATAAAISGADSTSNPLRLRERARPVAGYVLVLEDLTDLLRVQQTAAWREVAQRIAHEIKNPLTPIVLSAQRIRRRLAGPAAAAPAGDDLAVIGECAQAIEAEVQTLQRLVDEFGRFARFPHAQPVPCDLNEVIQGALRAFDGRLSGIEIRTRLDPLPSLLLDPDDMRRVFINLIDNAAEAMQNIPYRQITLATQLLDGVVEAVVADTGHGVRSGDKQRLFLPYYSTKERGTGLGLAIVQRIVEEYGGSVRVEDNAPLGARFILELPLENVPQPA